LIAEVVYGKGEHLWQDERSLLIHGETGALIFNKDDAQLLSLKGDSLHSQPLEVAGRKGLFWQDTHQVLEHLLDHKPLYVSPESSLYALKVADAARRSSELGQTVYVEG
jgi:biliverdin reductase